MDVSASANRERIRYTQGYMRVEGNERSRENEWGGVSVRNEEKKILRRVSKKEARWVRVSLRFKRMRERKAVKRLSEEVEMITSLTRGKLLGSS